MPRAISNPAPFHALAKITSFLAKYRKTLLMTRVKNVAMKVQRDQTQRPDARAVVFGLFAIIVICAAILAGTYLWQVTMPLRLDHGPTSKTAARPWPSPRPI
jgi:hypothetical protein